MDSRRASVKYRRPEGWRTYVPADRNALALLARRGVRVFLAVFAVALLTGALGLAILYSTLSQGLPETTEIASYDPAQTTKILASDGTLVATLFDQNRTYTPYEKISPLMIAALVAIEDQRFYEHSGLDFRGVLRAAYGNLASGSIQQGASTITMQLARALFLSDEQTYTRKAREAILARRIDRQLSKEKILELYLNEVYFGAGAYGIDAAANAYFSKNPMDLTLWESALLAGLVQAPTAYSPFDSREAALARTDEVLKAMLSSGVITEAAAEEASVAADRFSFQPKEAIMSEGLLKAPYFTTYALRQLAGQFQENRLRRGGYRVVTSLDLEIQRAAEEILAQSVEQRGARLGVETGAVVVIDNETGELVAMVGGLDWSENNQFNRAWQAMRQPGSAFKVFVFAAALEAGMSPELELADTEAIFEPGSPNPWKPRNSDGKFMGPIPLRTGLQFSRNLVAAKLIAHVTPARVIILARRFGIDSELDPVPSLALGAGEVSPLQMARAFSVFPNAGVLKETRAVRVITDAEGGIVEDYRGGVSSERVLEPNVAAVMVEMLGRVVAGGTGTEARVPGRFAAGKTGTTDDFIDAWFVGFTTSHTIAVWVGRDDNRPMGRVFGGSLPAEIFSRVAEKAAVVKGGQTGSAVLGLGSATTLELCWDSTYLAHPNCEKTYRETFRTEYLASRVCPLHRVREVRVSDAVVGDSALLASGAQQASQDPALRVERPLAAGAAPDGQGRDHTLDDDPREDPEVVTARGAGIPYLEKEPEVEAVRIVLEVGDEVDEQLPQTSELEPTPASPSVTEAEALHQRLESEGFQNVSTVSELEPEYPTAPRETVPAPNAYPGAALSASPSPDPAGLGRLQEAAERATTEVLHEGSMRLDEAPQAEVPKAP